MFSQFYEYNLFHEILISFHEIMPNEPLKDLSKDELIAIIFELKEEIIELKRRLKMNSNNSSKPPSSDGYNKGKDNKNRSLRGKNGESGKKR